jgi:putative transposase
MGRRRGSKLWFAAANTPQKVAGRGRLLLLAHQGVPNHAISQQLNLSRPIVLALRARFARDGMAAIKRGAETEAQRQGIDAGTGGEDPAYNLESAPGEGSTHWSVRMLAGQLGISRTIVHRFWQRHDVQPHRAERFKLSSDLRFWGTTFSMPK